MKAKPAQTKDEWRSLYPGNNVELLKALGILTRDERLNQDSRRKLKQVLHLIQILKEPLSEVNSLADMGSGKSYLVFLLKDLLFNERDVELFAVEARSELIQKCQDIAKQSLSSQKINFIKAQIDNAENDLPDQVDAVTALHACDTATDDAIHIGLKKRAKIIALVPCCQAEVARSLNEIRDVELDSLWDQNLHRREFGSMLTNTIRCLYLESQGYRVRATEFTGLDHSLKNELILAQKIQNSNPAAEKRLKNLLERIPVKMKLIESLSPR